MHVALFTDFHPATLGGIQTSVNALRRGLERAGHRVTVFAAPTPESTEPDPDLVVLSALTGVRVNGFAMVLPTPDNARRIDAAFADRGPIDIVHVQTTYGVAIAGLRAARRHGIPVVQTVHSRDDAFIQHTSPAPYLSALAVRLLHGRFVPHRKSLSHNGESRAARQAWHTMVNHARAADRVIVPTEHFADRFRAHGLDRPIRVISNGIDDELLDRARAATATATADDAKPRGSAADFTPETAGPLRVLWCARLSPEKRILEAIEAVRRTPGCTLDVYGSGDQEAAARAAIEAGDLADRVRLHGGVPQLDCLTAMAAHDVLLFPSVGFDTQGMALLEAVAMGLPVVYCDPDLAETVPQGGGLRTRDPSVASIAAALRDLAADPAQLIPMRKALSDHADTARQSRLIAQVTAEYTELTAARSDDGAASLDGIPTAPGRLPLLGHSLAALRGALPFVASLAEIGPIVRIYLGPRPAYVLTTPELIREVGFGEAGSFHREELREAMHEVIRGASNVLSGTPHELRRRMIAPALRQRRLAEYTVVAADLANAWADALPADRPLNLVDEAHRLVLDTISATLFTADFGAEAKREVRANVPWLLGQVIQRAALPRAVRRLRVVANRRFAAKSAALRGQIAAVVAEYRKSDRDFHDVLSALVRHTDPETGARLSDEEIVDELILMLAAGVGSTASIMTWVWHETMRNQDIGDELRRELDDFVAAGPVRPDHLVALPYLRLVVLETLRFWGPWVSTQTADGPVTIGGVTLPDGAMVVYSPYLVHHTERYYPAPETFDPDRWFAGRVEEIDKKAILPFGVGARHCPGNNFAVMTITLATAALFARWRPEPDPGYRVRPTTLDFVPSPAELPVVLHRR
ncbi:cytochrome P450 [Nocardia bhagyanarayanae]|uniref:Cytochrome P450 n=1 Tax=Nocardia bhagyanarayanae TaxID=1215925 RepID=A0A543EVK4_9NOCA|nr:cytochrome P450 [Nocardia bhagyanarayanae]TQM25604.1 cytochrome P450 [Nocardia bhagyanarayanae]